MAQETSGPWVAMAVLCETVMQEKSGALSLVRILERIQVQGPTPEIGLVNIKFTIVVGLKSGFYQGKAKVSIKPITPTNAEVPTFESTVLLEGSDRGANVIVAVQAFPVTEDGIYWFDVEVNGTLVTRIPLRVLYQQIAPMHPGMPGGKRPTGGQ